MKASELHQQDPTLKVLVYGDTGTGKTTWGALCPTPIVLLTEHQGLASIAAVAPDAEVEMVRDWQHLSGMVEHIKTGARTELGEQTAYEIKGRRGPITFQTLVIDSLTDVHDRLVEHHRVNDVEGRQVLKAWSKVQKDFRRLCHDLRSLPVNVVCLCLAHQVGGDDGSPRRILPLLYGKASESCGQYFNAVGYSHKRKEGYAIGWTLSSTYLTKNPPSLQRFPEWTINDFGDDPEGAHQLPGQTTLGSILAYLYPESKAAKRDEDDPLWIEKQL